MQIGLVGLYLAAIVAANLSVSWFGPAAVVVNAFFFIGLDFTSRDLLHDAWRGRWQWPRLFALVLAGGLLSLALGGNRAVALASCLAFIGAGLSDALSYQLLGQRTRLVRINGSNVVAAVVDSLVFASVLSLSGWPLLWGAVVGQVLAKITGGVLWSLLLAPWEEPQRSPERASLAVQIDERP